MATRRVNIGQLVPRLIQTTTPSWHWPVKQETQILSMYTVTITQSHLHISSSSPLPDMCGKEEEESESSASILINSQVDFHSLITRPCSILRKLLCRLRHLLMVKWLAEGDGDVLRRVWGNFFEFSKSHSNCGSDLMNTHKSRARGPRWCVREVGW